MSGDSESVVGEIPVVARLALGVERLILFVTNARIIVAHLGKRGAGAYATSALFGRLSGGFEDVVKSGSELRGKRALQTISPERILVANKDNFHLQFGEIVTVRLVETPSARRMTVLTRDNKFEFQTDHPLDNIVGMLRITLGSKLIVEKLPVETRSDRKR